MVGHEEEAESDHAFRRYLGEHHRASIPHTLLGKMHSLRDFVLAPIPLMFYTCNHSAPPDVIGYWLKLLEVGGIDSPDTRPGTVQGRTFPQHLSLTSQILYSPRCIKRIKRFIKEEMPSLLQKWGHRDEEHVWLLPLTHHS